MRLPAAALAAVVGITCLTAGAGRPDPYGAPAPLPALAPASLQARYAAARGSVEAGLATARRTHDSQRVRALSAFLRPGRRFLAFDARGTGQAIEAFGDLRAAGRIAIVVPGADNSLNNFDSWKFVGGGAHAVYTQSLRRDPGARVAVIAWLGYRSPATLSADVLATGRATNAGRELRRFVAGLRQVNGTAPITLLCHSYGSVICGKAAKGLPVQNIAVFGSPGLGVDHAADLKTSARIWAGRADHDWVGQLPNVRLLGVGFGQDPTARRFGARVFAAGSGAHSGYLKPGSTSLDNLALLTLGRDQEVSRV